MPKKSSESSSRRPARLRLQENHSSENDKVTPISKKQKLSKSEPKCEEKENFEVPIPRVKENGRNFVKFYQNYEMGLPCYKYKRCLKDMIVNFCRQFRVYKAESPFDRRVTFIVWHPSNPRLLSVTSHGGDVVLYDYEQDFSSACFIKGIGAGGSVQNMKFDPHDPVRIYTVSMEGKFLVLNFKTKEAKQYLETNDINRWYVSVDVNANSNLMVAGDTKGNLTILTLQGEVINTLQLHKKNYKISHAEFSKRESWLLCTSSTDGTIKLWDIRNLRSDVDKMFTPMQEIKHEKPINAAYFSLTDGCRLLTTDQFDKISIYRAPLWELETCIRHPHRQFQHLTPIKAYWHPFEDIVFVGRYPHELFPGYHEDELRTLDFFDAETGELLYQHYQDGFNGIMSLNRFNVTGDALASSYGRRFMVWKPDFKQMDRVSKRLDMLERSGKNDSTNVLKEEESYEIDWNSIFKKQQKEKKSNKKLKESNEKNDKK